MTDLTDHEKLEAIQRVLDSWDYDAHAPYMNTIRKILNDEPFDEDE
jgi:hypothetical protein